MDELRAAEICITCGLSTRIPRQTVPAEGAQGAELALHDLTVRDEALEEAAKVVDECNREGPYNAIGAASRIRELKCNEKRFHQSATPATAAQAEREKLADWMLAHSFATGHGETFEDLLKELSWQVEELRANAAVNSRSQQKRIAAQKGVEHARDTLIETGRLPGRRILA